MACFKPGTYKERLFRKLGTDSHNPATGISATDTVLGHNPAAQIGKKVAALIGLPGPNRYTGHCFRTSALTWLAEEGRTVSQMKALSDHPVSYTHLTLPTICSV